jgi:hypothetical protein
MTFKQMNQIIVFVAVILVSAAAWAATGTPLVINHQGRLLDASDKPVADGNYTIIYSLFTQPTGGVAVWTETQPVTTKGGLFSVMLGTITPMTQTMFDSDSLYLETQMQGEVAMTPRLRLSSVPSAMKTGRVLGDIQTSPNRVVVGDLNGDGMLDVHSTTDISELMVARKRPGRTKYSNINLRAFPDSVRDSRDCDSDDDGVPDGSYLQRITPTVSSVAINQKGTGADKNRVSSSAYPDSAIHVVGTDLDGNGVLESSVSSTTERRSGSIIILDNDGGEVSRTKVAADSGGSTLMGTVDLDGDGIPDVVVASTASPDSATQMMGKKGLNAVNVKLARTISSSVDASSVHQYLDDDSDDDGVMDRSISSSCDATGAKHAINTKGTGGTFGRMTSVTASTDESGAASSCDLDLDGDGVSECKESVSIGLGFSAVKGTFRTAGRAHANTTTETSATEMEGLSRVSADSDDDGVSDADATTTVTPTTCGVAIKTKGTGANDNRSASVLTSTDMSNVGVACVSDQDGDGIPEGEVSQSVTPTTCGVAIKTKGTGADANRMGSVACSTRVAAASILLEADVDGDGVMDRSVSEDCDDVSSRLVVSNIGSSGQDGVSISTGNGGGGGGGGSILLREAAHPVISKVVISAADGSAKIGIGTDTPSEALQVVGNICATGTIGACSDSRFKTNVETISNALEMIAKLRGVNFDWKRSEFPEKSFAEGRQIGFIAQEIKEVMPEVVSQGKDGFYSVDYAKLTPLLVEAAKQQQKEVDDLKAQVKKLSEMTAQLTANRDELQAQIKELSGMVDMILSAKNAQATTGRLASSK